MLPVGVAVGGQMGATGFAQRTFTKGGEEHTKAQEYLNLFMCCFGVAAASAAPLVLFNGVTAKMSLADTWRGFTFKQYVLTTSRETGFLFFMNAGERFEKEMQERYGDHWAVRYGTIFATNAFGSLLVHPFDTALTREQLSKPIRNLRQLALGAPAKSVAGGVFAVGYSASKRVLKGEKVL
ncbi:MAG: hypothetical protein MRY21_01850 [Simkaniaceae bacterium]|nr:hypothetical protein [Simkaniaceae bacterium]